MKKNLKDISRLVSAEAIFKRIKSLAIEAAFDKVKQAQTDLDLKVEYVMLSIEAKLLNESCSEFGKKIIQMEGFQPFEDFDFLNEKIVFDKVENEFEEAKKSLLDELKFKEISIEDYRKIFNQLKKSNEKIKGGEKDLLKNEENLRKIEIFSRKMEKRNQRLLKKLAKLQVKLEIIERIKGNDGNDEESQHLFDSIMKEDKKLSEIMKKISKVEEERIKTIETTKTLTSVSQELKNLINNFPSIKNSKQKLDEKEETLKKLHLTQKNLDNSLKIIEEKYRKTHKILEISLMTLAEIKTQINSKIKQKTLKALQLAKLQSFSVISIQTLILTQETLPKAKASKLVLENLAKKTRARINQINSSSESIHQKLLEAKKADIERKYNEELGTWIKKFSHK